MFFSSPIDLTPRVQNPARKDHPPRAGPSIRMQPAHQIAHVPANLASFGAGFHAEYAARRSAAK